QPTLAFDPNNATGVNPSTTSQAGDLTFSVKYTDANGDLPQRPAGGANTLKLVITKNDAPTYTQVASLDPTAPTTPPTAAQIKAGVIYTWTVPGTSSFIPPGTYRFYFTAGD